MNEEQAIRVLAEVDSTTMQLESEDTHPVSDGPRDIAIETPRDKIICGLVTVKNNLATKLILNAMGNGDEEMRRWILSVNGDVARSVRDDCSVAYVYFAVFGHYQSICSDFFSSAGFYCQ